MSNLSHSSIAVSTLGTPRIGPRRELKFALEQYWSGKLDERGLLEIAAGLRAANWARQHALGVTVIPSNDFSLYDHVLDTSVMVGAIPEIYGWEGGPVSLETYFAMARGSQTGVGDHSHDHADCAHGHETHHGVPAQEMTKWFDTNYHYMVPEFTRDQQFALSSTKVFDEYREAKSLGFETRPVLIGPVTFLMLGKNKGSEFDTLSLLPRLLPIYTEVLQQLAAAGTQWVQLDEPCLALDLAEEAKSALRTAYAELAARVPNIRIMLTSYFGDLGDNVDIALSLPVSGIHLDLVRGAEQINAIVARVSDKMVLSLGIIDGRNIWRADLSPILGTLKLIAAKRGVDRIEIAPSCSLLHVPIDLDLETKLDSDLRSWLAFSVQKMDELATLGAALAAGRDKVMDKLAASDAAIASRKASPKVHDQAVQQRITGITTAMQSRSGVFADRAKTQHAAFNLPVFPTTTIGSFPQTSDVRKARSAYGKGTITDLEYTTFLRNETAKAVRWQDSIGLDVLVHGEFERNDMVQYFGEQLRGFAFSAHGWVQSYGSRCVRPPILFGDVSRPKPMTVEWWQYAQSLTTRPMKGMLTGPVTILNWSFVRDDIPRSESCRQIAFAIRDEVLDLEKAGAAMIQIDEAALREGLPLRHAQWKDYLAWAVESFRLCSSGVRDATQIHTHMCYSEFNDIIDAIAAMDADVISIETSRSQMELLDAFKTYRYPNEIGPGVYDIHSPRVPEISDMVALLKLARQRLSDAQLWINPDCGLKTRGWAEVRPALINMVAAAKEMRADT